MTNLVYLNLRHLQFIKQLYIYQYGSIKTDISNPTILNLTMFNSFITKKSSYQYIFNPIIILPIFIVPINIILLQITSQQFDFISKFINMKSQKSSSKKSPTNQKYIYKSPKKSKHSDTQNESDIEQSLESINKKLRKKIIQLHRKQSIILTQMAQLQNQNEFLTNKIDKVQQKNKSLIQKLSFEQIQKKELQYKWNKNEGYMNDYIGRQKEEMRGMIDKLKKNIEDLDLRYELLRDRQKQFVYIIRSINDRIKSCNRYENFEGNINKVKQLIEKSIKVINSDKSISQQVVKMIKDNNLQEQQRKQLYSEIQEKKKKLEEYSIILNKLRSSCSDLKIKVDSIQKKSLMDKQLYQNIINQKNQIILKLEDKNQQLFLMLQQSQQKQRILQSQLNNITRYNNNIQSKTIHTDQISNSQHKKKYIPDTKKTLIKKQLQQIDSQILQIQNNLIKQLSNHH